MRARALPRSLSRTLGGVLAFGLALMACGPATPLEPELVLSVHSASPLVALPEIPPDAIGAGARALGPHRFAVRRAALRASLEIEGFCPADVPRTRSSPVLDVTLTPWLEVLAPPPVGFDAPFEVEVRPGCREVLAGSIAWQALDGEGAPDPEGELVVERRGFLLHGRTAPLDTQRLTPPWGIVPISARTSGAITLRLRYVRAGHAPLVREVTVLAAARATGLPSIAVGAGVLLRGGPFRITESPPGARAQIEPQGALERFVPDVPGRWVLSDASARSLALRSGTHADTPLDCGRAPCHQRETELARASPMASALAGHLEACALRCHATGEPGLPDGGFLHVASEGDWSIGAEPLGDVETLPRALRRLAGVGCTACHGPGAIPEQSARWAILRTDVCASCHDAPPRYGHVAAWSRSSMSRSDVRPETRAPACARCHTTAGFLASIGARAETAVPDDAGALGIACAACHAPHAEARLARALVRRVAIPVALGSLPAAWEGSAATVCLRCHAPDEGETAATSAAVLLGVGGVDEAGGPLSASAAEAPHRDVPCTDCHAASSAGAVLERGAGHAFAIDRARCMRCHEGADVDAFFARREVVRAAAGARAEDVGLDGTVAHPSVAGATASARNAALVLADRGAWAHAPGYTRRLLGL